MQFKLSVATLALATLAAATATPSRRNSIPAGQCNTGPVQCCDSTGTAKDASISKILALLGITVQDVNALIGVTCTPITAVGVGGNSCTAQSVCCTDNSFKGVVAIGCTPVNLSL